MSNLLGELYRSLAPEPRRKRYTEHNRGRFSVGSASSIMLESGTARSIDIRTEIIHVDHDFTRRGGRDFCPEGRSYALVQMLIARYQRMIVGIPKEIKDRENRVSTTPAGVSEYVAHGHTVLVERDAGIGSGFADAEYERAGATIDRRPRGRLRGADMIVKVKEPVASEYELLKAEPAPLHLSPPGRRRAADPRADGAQGAGGRLRNRPARRMDRCRC